MKKVLLTLTMSFIFLVSSQAQTEPREKELGITFTGFTNFGITYRAQLKNQKWFRFRGVSTIGNFEKSNDTNDTERERTNFSVGIALGKEKRTPINDRLDFRFGVDGSLGYLHSDYLRSSSSGNTITSLNTNRYSIGVNAVIGINYKINSQFYIGAEILPGLSYSYTVDKREDTNNNNTVSRDTYTSQIEGQLRSSSILLSLVYRFP